MILVIAAMTDAYTQMLQVSELGGQISQGTMILDGPSPFDTGAAGIAVGASLEDPSGEFAIEKAAVQGDGRQRFTLRCIAWALSGETVWQKSRNKCTDIVRIAEATLATDRTMMGTVSSAFMVGGSFAQQMSDVGNLVTCEFRIDAVRF
jgi:hypothetical protein